MSGPMLEVRGLTLSFGAAEQARTVLQGVDLQLARGQAFGLVGESGSGKTTVLRCLAGQYRHWQGQLAIDGQACSATPERGHARRVQMVFQDPYGSLDPRQRVERIVAEPLSAHGITSREEQRERATTVLLSVGLRGGDLDKYPHEFSGGQRQRIAIARALITRPKLIVADEPVSGLDVSVQAQVLNLLDDLRSEFGITYLLISHDLSVVDHLCDDVAVMTQGRIVEMGTAQSIFQSAAHPYTQALLKAVPHTGAA